MSYLTVCSFLFLRFKDGRELHQNKSLANINEFTVLHIVSDFNMPLLHQKHRMTKFRYGALEIQGVLIMLLSCILLFI